jgi:hypothetical protein
MALDKRYVKFPTRFVEFITMAKLTENQNKMLHSAIRNTHGFHQPERMFDLTDLRRWLGWDRRSVYRTAEELLQRSIFVIPRDDKNGHKYRINNDSQKWNREWKRVSVGNSVDKSVDKLLITPDQPSLLGAILSSRGMTNRAPRAHLSTENGRLSDEEQMPLKSSRDKENLAGEKSKIVDASDFLKISLKKILKKGPDPDFEKRKESKKKKAEIFMQMSRSGRWTDDELLELAKNLTADELDALLSPKRATH